MKRYGITAEARDQAKADQNNQCAICERGNVRLCVDHNHLTKRFRGMLCDRCNGILGIWKDSPRIAQKAVDYLKAC